jgi:two-component system heavy metal sensor histidine kinase CusS
MSFADNLTVTATQPVDQGSRQVGERQHSLASRLTIMVFGACFGTVLLACGIAYLAMERTLYHAEDQVLRQRAQTALDWLESGPYDEALLYHEITENTIEPREIYLRILNGSGTFSIETPGMEKSVPPALFPPPRDLALGEARTMTIYNERGQAFRSLAMRVAGGGAINEKEIFVQASSNTSLDDEAIRWFLQLLLAVLVGGMIICLLLARSISRRGLAPLKQIAMAAKGLDAQRLDYRLERKDLPSEVSELAGEINGMLGRLELTYQGLRHYADNVAHELRGPINKMLLEADTTLNRERADEAYRDALEANAEEARHLATIVSSILFLARAESGAMDISRETVHIGRELTRIAEFFEASADEAGMVIRVELPEDLTVQGDRVLIQRAVSNLVSNAISHGKPNGVVVVRAETGDGMVRIHVIDDGEGIPADKIAHVFERFYRVDGVRTSGSRLGLGLPISRSIAVLHRGGIHLKSIEGQGTHVVLELAVS